VNSHNPAILKTLRVPIEDLSAIPLLAEHFKNTGLNQAFSMALGKKGLATAAEADKILEWLRQEINSTWEKRDAIEPSFDTPAKPRIFDILKLLPKTNCGECGQPTCTVFASVVAQGAKGPEDCPPLDDKNKMKIQEYLRQFTFDS
jgi:ArsR family metal-binding transcriptional regulator